jgi:hypothetical protein
MHRFVRGGVVGLLAFLAMAGANPPGAAPGPSTPPPPAAAPASPVDQPLRLAAEANQAFQGVRDYTCLFIKKERLRGTLQPDNLIEMKVRNQPFSVYLRWLHPKNLEGQQACYVAGRNQNMMRVHSTGILGIAGFVTLDTHDARVMENSRHTITEAGIGHLITQLLQSWEMERRLGKTQVRLADYTYNRLPCTRVEMIHPDNSGRQFTSYRTVVYFDKASHLPIRIEKYDWPRSGGPAQGELLESYSYINLRTNVGLGENAFNY